MAALEADYPDDRGADQDLAPILAADGTPITFDRWYSRWLDEAIGSA